MCIYTQLGGHLELGWRPIWLNDVLGLKGARVNDLKTTSILDVQSVYILIINMFLCARFVGIGFEVNCWFWLYIPWLVWTKRVLEVPVSYMNRTCMYVFGRLHTGYGALVAVRIQSLLNPPSSTYITGYTGTLPLSTGLPFIWQILSANPVRGSTFLMRLLLSSSRSNFKSQHRDALLVLRRISLLRVSVIGGGRRGPKFLEKLLLNVLEVRRSDWLVLTHQSGGQELVFLVWLLKGADVEN